MSIKVGIVGDYGTGKSTSLLPIPGHKGLDPKTTIIVNCLDKDLPMKGAGKLYNKENKNVLCPKDVVQASNWLESIAKSMPNIKNVIIDDFIYLTTKHLIDKAEDHGFQKYNTTAGNVGKLMNAASSFGDDVFVFFMFHQEMEKDGAYRVKSASKMIDKLMNLEGLFTYLLYSDVGLDDEGKVKYSFITNTSANSQGVIVRAKSPIGCFEELLIPNDLGLVVEKIKAYRN